MINQLRDSISTPVLVGFVFWCLAMLLSIPYSLFEITHVQLLLIAAPSWLIPLTYRLEYYPKNLLWTAVICGIAFSISYLIPESLFSVLLVFPWLLFSVFQVYKISSRFNLSTSHVLKTGSHIYLCVGILWALADRGNIQPMGFDPVIVLLTGVHFHYAGFILLYATERLLKIDNMKYGNTLAILIMMGIPLVAIGITSTELNWPPIIEVISVTIMTLTGALVGLLYIRYSVHIYPSAAALLFTIGGVALTIGMSLAFCYGWRHLFVIEALSIPWMYAVHGTCNAVGFAIPILIGWLFVEQKNIRN